MKRLPIVALIGQTNAGKSSLLNRLARRRVAIVAREAGTTRDNVMANIDGQFLLIDTAGLKDPADEFEAGIQAQITDAIDSADLILFVLDSSKPFDHHDQTIARSLHRSKKPYLTILNKSDRGDALDLATFRPLGIDPEQTFRTSATTGQGINGLRRRLENSFAGASRSHDKGKRSRQFGNNSIEDFSEAVEAGGTSSKGPFAGYDRERACRPRDGGRRQRVPREDGVAGFDHPPLKIALIGRPNVGKSSLFNSLGKKQQALVSSRQGTTRDINRIRVNYHKRPLEILDTAGLRRPGKREVGIEKFSALRTLAAIEEADICALLIDATEPHAKLDQSLAGQIIEAGKGIVLIITKTDLIKSPKTSTPEPESPTTASKTSETVAKTPETATIDSILDNLQRDFNFLPYAPVLLTSSETGKNVAKLFDLAFEIDESRHTEVPTPELNKILNDAILSHPPAGLKNTRPKPKYIVQTDTCPPWFVVHGHNLGLLHWSWQRFLERKVREKYPFVGTPIRFSFISDEDVK